MTELLAMMAAGYKIPLTDEMLRHFDWYRDILLRWNQTVNLTAITDPEDIAVKHFLDSLLILAVAEIPVGASLLDVGTGAGFPGVPLKIARPDLSLTLMDSLGKRVTFLEELSQMLCQKNQIHHLRAEEAGHQEAFRERFDVVTARAVARLSPLCEYCLPFVRPGGFFLAMKGPGAEEELEEARQAISLLGGRVGAVDSLHLPKGDIRVIIRVEKISQTPTKYPRRQDKIKKTPL